MLNDSEGIQGDLWLRDSTSLIAVGQRAERWPQMRGEGGKASPLTLGRGGRGLEHQTCIGKVEGQRLWGRGVEARKCFRRNSWRGRVFLRGASARLQGPTCAGRKEE